MIAESLFKLNPSLVLSACHGVLAAKTTIHDLPLEEAWWNQTEALNSLQISESRDEVMLHWGNHFAPSRSNGGKQSIQL